jgi:hypothetical protein
VFGADAGVVEPSGDGVRVEDLSVVVGEYGRAGAMQDAGAAGGQARRAGGLDPDQPDVTVLEEAGEDPDGIGAPADARYDGVGQPVLRGEQLLARLAADDRLKFLDDRGVGMRAYAGADQVVRRLNVGDPVADGLARGLLEGARPELDRHHLGAEEVHPLDVRSLAAHVLGAHVDHGVDPEFRAHRRGGHAVLAGAGLGHDPPLSEPLREHGLAERVVELVGAGVEEVLTLEVEPLSGSEPLCARQGRGPSPVLRAQPMQFLTEGWVGECFLPAPLELIERRNEGLGNEAASELSESPRLHCRHSRSFASVAGRTSHASRTARRSEYDGSRRG